MQSMSVLRSAARRTAVACGRRGLSAAANAAAADAERASVAALVQQEVRAQLRAGKAARAEAEREGVAALVRREVRDRLLDVERLRAEAEWRAYLRRRVAEAATGLWGDSWGVGFVAGYATCFVSWGYMYLLSR